MKEIAGFEVIFLGTGTSVGVPMIGCTCATCSSKDSRDKRLRSSVIVRSKNTTILIDAGPDMRAQLLGAKINHIDAVLMTHAHKDHVGGIDDLRAFSLLTQKPVQIYATRETQAGIKKEVPYAFEEPIYVSAPKIEFHTIENNIPFQVNELRVIPISVWHGTIPILGFRIGNFTYITDCKHIEESEYQKIKGSEYFVINGIRWEKHNTHFSIGESISLAQKVQARKTYITHISHQLGKHGDVSTKLPNDIELAFDGLIVSCK